jgi:hypothetical protein
VSDREPAAADGEQTPAPAAPPVDEGGDPPCWAHLFDDEDEDEPAAHDEAGEATVEVEANGPPTPPGTDEQIT